MTRDPALDAAAKSTTPELPAGTVTFLTTDIEGSTRLWDEDSASMQQALARHDSLAGEHVQRSGGRLVESGREGRFVGRSREIDEVMELLSSSSLVTITGAGGIGKTRLALQVASRLVDAYEDGVWLVELASLTDPDLVPQAVMAVLDFRDQPGRESLATLAINLASRRSLLVLDTCEHLIAPVSRLVGHLLQACPRLQILATSREVLGIDGEVAWRVPSLSVPGLDALPPLDELVEYEAVALFADRASAMGGFRVTAETAPAMAEVCHRLDGMPLAIELAAARLKILVEPRLSLAPVS